MNIKWFAIVGIIFYLVVAGCAVQYSDSAAEQENKTDYVEETKSEYRWETITRESEVAGRFHEITQIIEIDGGRYLRTIVVGGSNRPTVAMVKMN